MNTNKELLSKGIKYITISIPCLFIGPAVIHFAFINKLQPLYYLILAIGIGIGITAMLMLYKGLNTIMKSLFNK
ncbi:MAG: DUF6095 family protein [Flavobacterium sp.]|jgi:hypothetical protein|nr:DUF6095 family protein [Flavobacterium sp.]